MGFEFFLHPVDQDRSAFFFLFWALASNKLHDCLACLAQYKASGKTEKYSGAWSVIGLRIQRLTCLQCD